MKDYKYNAKMSHDIWEYRAAEEVRNILSLYLEADIIKGDYSCKFDDINNKIDYIFLTANKPINIQFRFRKRTTAPGYEDYNNEFKIKTYSRDPSGKYVPSEFFKDSFDFFIYGVVDNPGPDDSWKEVESLLVVDMKKFRKYRPYIAISNNGSFYSSHYNKEGVWDPSTITNYYPEDSFKNEGSITLRLPISNKHKAAPGSSMENLFNDCIVYKRGF